MHLITKLISLFLLLIFPLCSTNAAHRFYFKTFINGVKLNDLESVNIEHKNKVIHHPMFSNGLGIGVGYYINNYSRVDIILDHNDLYFHNDYLNFHYVNHDLLTEGANVARRKAETRTLMLNYYLDFIKRDFFDLFVGVGLGVGKIKERNYYLLSGSAIDNNANVFVFPLIIDKYFNRSSTNLVSQVSIGINFKPNDPLNWELIYSFRDYGSTNTYIPNTEHIAINNHYVGHHISLGIRLNL